MLFQCSQWHIGNGNLVKMWEDVWRACREGLPTKVNMRKRKVEVKTKCVLCNSGWEDLKHVLNMELSYSSMLGIEDDMLILNVALFLLRNGRYKCSNYLLFN